MAWQALDVAISFLVVWASCPHWTSEMPIPQEFSNAQFKACHASIVCYAEANAPSQICGALRT
ncbi:hypothetical protein H6H03_25895 [Nostoc paludosum FACHB-159]|uniref:Secreted protein n=1 Tax=Nostoc paludosum FACHB-159 TaxID=2692908 RepID=A0ABR8KCM3_9NOSO|nr:hypothetical protein [Nostoc paludosum FACHB-159]